MTENQNNLGAIAIVGMAGRFPGAKDIHELWKNLAAGKESISQLREEELEAGDPSLWNQPNFVKARGVLDDVDLFDANFWGMHPKEAETTDPQHRVFMECAWQALEDAGYDSQAYEGAIGVFAGCSMNTYFLRNLCSDREFVDEFTRTYQVGSYPSLVGNHVDFLATKVAYKLNLRGPAFTIQCGCSTSLVAICQACQSLLTYQSDMALAGGVSVSFPQKRGYLYQQDGMASPDGHCRTFDAKAQGTVFGSGAAVVLLKRLEDAVTDGDHIYAVIRGFAVNNDGSAKVGYAAPGVDGQSEVIAMAQAAAGVSADSISYIECHGTGTPLGDPVEVAAATKAFRASTDAKGFCAVGTVKTNVGHLDIAAGATGLIKTALSLQNELLPATLYFEKPNPKLELQNSPFYVNSQPTKWKRNDTPRRAGVSAFGVGGTNAHVILEEAPTVTPSVSKRDFQLLLLSAKTASALEKTRSSLAQHLRTNSNANLADVAFTLQSGRRHFEHRGFVVARNTADAILALESDSNTDKGGPTVATKSGEPSLVLMFPGQGAQYCNMGAQLYETEPEYRKWVDKSADILNPLLRRDLREVLYPKDPDSDVAKNLLTSTEFAQPALFVTEFALAKLWMSWGIAPAAMIGHSVGEIVAACLGEVFSLGDALRLVATRGQMMQGLPGGSMLAVRLPEAEVGAYLGSELSIAAINSSTLCVVSGPNVKIRELESTLKSRRVVSRRLQTSHAFHSSMMDSIVDPFLQIVRKINLKPPSIPFISTVTGRWITAEEATDPTYWATHLRKPVRFADGLSTLASMTNAVLLESGPGNTLTGLALQHAGKKEQIAVPSLPDSSGSGTDVDATMNALGRLWASGVRPDWEVFHQNERLHRVPLPTYPFERKRYWVEPKEQKLPATATASAPADLPAHSYPARPQQEGAVPKESRNDLNGTHSSLRQPRQQRIQSDLLSLFEELSGIAASEIDPAASFVELGFDSLFLTQVTQELQNKFGLKITFRQLFGHESTVDALASYIDSKVPGDIATATESQAQSSEVLSNSNASGAAIAALPSSENASTENRAISPAASSNLESLMKEQLRTMSELMSRQLDVLRGSSSASANAHDLPVTIPSASVVLDQRKAQPTIAAGVAGKEESKAFSPFKPLTTGRAGGLTSQQENHISALIDRYTKKTGKSKELTQKYRSVLADPRVVAGFRSQWKEIVYPIVTDHSDGSKLYDVDGNEYIDILNGYGPTVFGHKPKFVTDAVHRQMELGFEIGPMSPLAGQVAELVSELTGMERVAFCNTGSEAVLCAMRVARTVTGRNKIVMFAGAYHGMFDEVLVKGIKKPGAAPRSMPIAPGIPPQMAENIVVLDYGTAESLEFMRAHAREFAAILVEPVQSRHPNLQPREFLAELRKITEASETALIFDEVVTGFRAHPGGVQALFGIRADIATYGKVIGGGLPIGLLAGKAKFMDALDGGAWQYGDDSFPEVGVTFFAGTFVRHPLALAATLSVLEHLKQQGPQLQQRLNDKTAELVARLNSYLSERGVPITIESFASIFYFGFPVDLRFGSLFYYHMREKGIHIQEGFPCFLTTAHSTTDIEKIVVAFKQSIAEMQADDMLPGMSSGSSADRAKEIQPPLLTSASIGDAPLTEAQMEVWLSAQFSDEASCAFNESLTLHLQGRLDEAALRESMDRVVARHDALRTTFSRGGDRQYFHSELKIELPVIDLCGLDAEVRDARLRELKEEQAKTPFDLVAGPVARFRLVRLSAEHHALLFTVHHIVCDGWSTNVILDELSKLYSSKVSGEPMDLRRAVSFGEYAKLQKHDQETDLSGEKYWLEQFSEIPSNLDLPTDRPRQSRRSYEGATFRKKISSDIYQGIKRAGAKRGCTLFSTLLAGFHTLLARLSSQNDIVVGIPTAGQSLLEEQTLVGHCVNFLPLRARFGEEMKFTELLQQDKRRLLDAYEHQSYTYGTLVQKLSLRRDPSRLPLLEVQFNLERVGADMEFRGLRAEVDPNPKAFVNFDLFLNIVESPDGLTLDCDYNTALYDEATVDRWLRHYETVLLAVSVDAEQPIRSLPLLTETEKRQILVEWNATEMDYPRDQCIHDLFEEQAQNSPNATAVSFEKKSLTYGELNQKANQLANHLSKIGAVGKSIVGIYMDRSLEMMIALLGILKAGAAYLPLDPAYPKDRIGFILEEAHPLVLLTQSHLAVSLPPREDARIVCVDSDWQLIARESGSKPGLVSSSSHDPAYLIYTSGTTGKPKGVEVSHRSVVNLLASISREPGIDAGDKMFAVTTLSFDIAALELFLPLIIGGEVIIASRDVASDPVQLMARLIRCGATVMQATPATWRMLLDAGWEGHPLKKILCGGEALPRELADRLLQLQVPLWNMYGPTETTIWSAAGQVRSASAIVIGPPVANTQFYILDRHNQPAPIGVPGELWISGDGVARGYYNHAELTAERFIENPFRSGSKMYRTGDKARFLADGKIEFLGRLDHQVKLRGYRIELEEIEAVLAQHSGVRQAIAMVREDNSGDQRLVAYITSKNGNIPSSELRDFSGQKLPDYMIPSAFVLLHSFPLTASGKVDRKAFPEPGLGQQPSDREYSPPSSENQKTLAQIWSEVLRLERVGINDNILELGADSIHIFQITARANEAGIEVSAKQFLQSGTIANLCNTIDGSEPIRARVARIPRVSRELYQVKSPHQVC
jgi:amino acid adenylation domain-containing protein